MGTTLNYGLLYNGGLAELSRHNRLPVLVALILHTNERNRAFPSIETLCRETGLSNKTVISARQWLEEHGAIELVPYDKRVGEKEEGLEPRSLVYQITGTVNIDGVRVPYLYIHQELPGAAKVEILQDVETTHKLVPESTGKELYPIPPAAEASPDVPKEPEQQTPTGTSETSTRPSKQRPPNPFYDAVRQTMFGDVPDAGIKASSGRVVGVMGVIREYEKGQGKTLSLEEYGSKVRLFWSWYKKEHPKLPLKSESTVLEYWSKFDLVKPPAPPKRLVEPESPWLAAGFENYTDWMDALEKKREEDKIRRAEEKFRRMGVIK